MRQYTVFQTPDELGKLARLGRESQGLALRVAAPQAKVGPRFLSEFERGKPTAEFAKVMAAVHIAGLDLAVVERPITDGVDGDQSGYYSRSLDTEFPYDWSNSQMEEGVFIRKVLKAARFNDVLKIVSYFGFDKVSNELSCLQDTVVSSKMVSMLLRIQKGFLLACCQRHDPAL
ncbi:MAG: hypothetical protein GXP22_07845 [Gammaproteobacteria bacterium]|nr:hypothetical protein [Gammaproteobacteria bacterium]